MKIEIEQLKTRHNQMKLHTPKQPTKTIEEICTHIRNHKDVLGMKTKKRQGLETLNKNNFGHINKKIYDLKKVKIKVYDRCILKPDEIKTLQQDIIKHNKIRKLDPSITSVKPTPNMNDEFDETDRPFDYNFYKKKINRWFADNPGKAIDPLELAKKVRFLIFDKEDKQEWMKIIDKLQLKSREHDGVTYIYKEVI